MANDLITIDGKTDINDIMFLTGQTGFDNNDEVGSIGPYGFLKINSAFEEETGEVNEATGKKVYRRLPSGSFMLNLPKIGKVFAEAVKFRILQRGFQYTIYNPDDNKTLNRSRIINNFNEEAYDEKGTVKCGSISKKKREGLTPDQLKFQATIKCTQLLYGVVTFISPVDVSGNAVEGVEDVPVLFRTNGSNFKIAGDLIDELTSKKKVMATTPITMTTERQVNGSVTYYTLLTKVDYTASPVWRAELDIDVLNTFKTDIKATNVQIYDKYVVAINKKASATADVSLLASLDGKTAAASLSGDFHDDDISHLGTNKDPIPKSPSTRGRAKSDMMAAG